MNWMKKICFIFLILLTLILYLNVEAGMNDGVEKGIQLFDEQKFPEAKKFFKSFAEKNSKNYTAAFYLGRIFLKERDYEAAIDWLKKAVNLNKNSSEYHLLLGRAYGMKARKVSFLKKALLAKYVKNEFEKAVELDPDNLNARFDLIKYYLMAPGIMGGSKDKAREQAEEIKKRDSSQGHTAIGLIYDVEKKYDQAEKEYLTGIEEDSQSFKLYYRLGLLYEKRKKYDKAFDILEKIVADLPDEIFAYYLIGRIALMSGQNLDRAEECFKKYLQIESKKNSNSLAHVHCMLGNVYMAKGQKEHAKIEYEAALKLDPDHKKAKKCLEDLE